MVKKNGYSLDAQWRNWTRDHRGLYSSIHVAMFHTLSAMNNRAGWREQFTIKTLELMAETGITSRTTFIKIVGDLVKWHFVTIVSPAKNQYADYVITLPLFENDLHDQNMINQNGTPVHEMNKQNKNACPPNEQAHPRNEQANSPNEQANPLNEQANTGNEPMTHDSEGVKLLQTINKTIINNKEARTQKIKFKIPSIEEVKKYCAERGNKIDPEYFFDYYTANGWTQGRNKPIRDWQAAVRTWEKRELDKSFNNQSHKPNEPSMDFSPEKMRFDKSFNNNKKWPNEPIRDYSPEKMRL